MLAAPSNVSAVASSVIATTSAAFATASESAYEEDATHSYDQQRLFLYLRYYARHIIPVFCLVGILGNAMALTLIRTNYWLRRLTSNIYLCTLSLSSCIFLATVATTWLDTVLDFSLYSDSVFGCKIATFLAHACDFICAWSIVWVSCDRAIVLFRPGIRKRVCSKTFARHLVVCTVLFSSTLYGWCLIFAGLEVSEGTTYCGLNSDFKVANYNLRQLHLFFSLLDTILCTVVPSLLITIVNSLSIYRYRQCMKIYSSGVLRVRFLRVSPETEKPPTEDAPTKKFLLSQHSQATVTTHNPLSTQSSRSHSNKLRSSDLTLSRSLLIVTSTFVLLNVPNYSLRLYEAVFDVEQSHLYQFAFFLSFLLYYAHHAAIFYTYVFWSPQVRKQ